MSQPLGNLPINAKIKFGTIFNNPMVWQIKAKNHPGYPDQSVTVVTERIIRLMAVDAMEAANSDSNRKIYGNNRYIHSNLRQWLNKTGHPWYVAQHTADAPPTAANTIMISTPYDNVPGFLTGFTPEEIDAIISTTLVVNRAAVDDGGGQDTFSDKIFLLSSTEVGFTADTAQGSLLEGFVTDNPSPLAYPTADAVRESSWKEGVNTGAAWLWWLRTPVASDPPSVRIVSTSGTPFWGHAYSGRVGLRPACNLSATQRLVGPDEDLCYTLI